MALRASVVVPTFRRPESLSRCLAALCAQAFDPTAYEVIVADDAASDEARRVVTCWAERAAARGLALRYVPVTGAHGPAAARNAGWRAARGQIIAFTDDDCLPAPDWLAAGGAPVLGGGGGGGGARGARIAICSSPSWAVTPGSCASPMRRSSMPCDRHAGARVCASSVRACSMPC